PFNAPSTEDPHQAEADQIHEAIPMHCYGTKLNCHGVNFGISKHVRVSSQQNIVDNTPRRSRHRVAMRGFCCGMGSYMRTVLGSVMVGVAGLVLGGAASGQSTTGLALAQSSHCM